MPKIVDKAKMKETILQASLKAFLKYGFYNTTMNLIAKEAGIAKGTLYLYFDSKESLSLEFAKNHFHHMEEKMMVKKEFHSLDDLFAHIKSTIMISEEEAKYIPVFFEAFGPSFHSQEFIMTIAEFFERMGVYYADIISTLIDKKEITSDVNPQALGHVWVSMLDGIILHRGLFNLTAKSHEVMVDEMILVLKRGLTTP